MSTTLLTLDKDINITHTTLTRPLRKTLHNFVLSHKLPYKINQYYTYCTFYCDNEAIQATHQHIQIKNKQNKNRIINDNSMMMCPPPPLGTLSQGLNSLLVVMLTRYHLVWSPGIIWYGHQVSFGMVTRYHLVCLSGMDLNTLR